MHSHGPQPSSLTAGREDNRRRMVLALGINASLLVAEVLGGLITGSLALLADAGHVLSDLGAIGLGLFVARLAARPPSAGRTFGFRRSEILAALLNGLVLVAIAVAIAVVAVGRLGDPPDVAGFGVVALGAVSLAANLSATLILAGGSRQDLNLEAVLRHSFADALGSLGVIAAGATILATGWELADPLVSLVIAGLVIASSWRLIAEPVNVLMEAAPSGMDVDRLGSEICALDGVREVHDLHVWTVTAGFPALAAHVVVGPDSDRDLVRHRIESLLREHHGIDHTTLQMVTEATPGLIEIDAPPTYSADG